MRRREIGGAFAFEVRHDLRAKVFFTRLSGFLVRLNVLLRLRRAHAVLPRLLLGGVGGGAVHCGVGFGTLLSGGQEPVHHAANLRRDFGVEFPRGAVNPLQPLGDAGEDAPKRGTGGLAFAEVLLPRPRPLLLLFRRERRERLRAQEFSGRRGVVKETLLLFRERRRIAGADFLRVNLHLLEREVADLMEERGGVRVLEEADKDAFGRDVDRAERFAGSALKERRSKEEAV